jgi:hypothetical protein
MYALFFYLFVASAHFQVQYLSESCSQAVIDLINLSNKKSTSIADFQQQFLRKEILISNYFGNKLGVFPCNQPLPFFLIDRYRVLGAATLSSGACFCKIWKFPPS